MEKLSPVHFLFMGMAIFQIVYIGYHSVLFRRKEFFAYLVFTILISCFVLFETSSNWSLQGIALSAEGTRSVLLRVSILMFAGVFYLRFSRFLMDSARLHPLFNTLGIWTERLILGGLIVSVPGILFSPSIAFYVKLYSVLYLVVFPAQLYMLYVMIKHRTVYTGLVISGTILMMIALRFTYFKLIFTGIQPNEMLSQGIVIGGVALNFLFVNLSLIFRSKEIQKEKLNLEIAKRDELNRQRMNISNDLHDDAGASLSSLYLYSTMAESVVGKDTHTAQKHLLRISKGLREVMENMNDIVWAVSRDEQNEKLFSSRIKDFAYELSGAKGIDINYRIDPDLERSIKDIPVRRNLLLITKEALNNAIKHSGARQITLNLLQIDDHLHLEVVDDGCGFDPILAKNGHGLNTLKTRAETVGGILTIESTPHGNGTTVSCIIPIARISD